MIEDIDDWADQAEVVEGHVRLLRIATEYKDLLLVLKEGDAGDAASTGWDGATVDATDAYDDAKVISDEDEGDTTGRKETWDAKIESTASALVTLDNLIARLATQEAEEAAQSSIKDLADADYALQVDVQAAAVEDLETATGDKEDADADFEEKTEL
jgi:hypothetical protein